MGLLRNEHTGETLRSICSQGLPLQYLTTRPDWKLPKYSITKLNSFLCISKMVYALLPETQCCRSPHNDTERCSGQAASWKMQLMETVYSVQFQLCLKSFVYSWEKMDKRWIAFITEWWDYKVFSLLWIQLYFPNFLQWIDIFVTRRNLISEEAIAQNPLSIQKGLAYPRVKAGHGKIFREFRRIFLPNGRNGRCEERVSATRLLTSWLCGL